MEKGIPLRKAKAGDWWGQCDWTQRSKHTEQVLGSEGGPDTAQPCTDFEMSEMRSHCRALTTEVTYDKFQQPHYGCCVENVGEVGRRARRQL